jgi:hypothetical protein
MHKQTAVMYGRMHHAEVASSIKRQMNQQTASYAAVTL